MWDRHRASRRRAVAAASAVALGALTRDAVAAVQSPGGFIDLLHFVEQVQIDRYEALLAAFDAAAFASAGLPDGSREGIEAILAAEKTHIALVTRPRGIEVPAPPRAVAPSLTDELRAAAVMENVATAAYAAILPVMNRRRLLPSLIGIHSVEARHAAWLAALVGDDPFPDAIDGALAPEEVLARLGLRMQGTEPAATPAATPVSDAAAGTPPLDAIARELGVPPADLTIVRLERHDWPDAGLGCPKPGTVYAQVITPGYLVEVDIAGKKVEVHTDDRGNVVRCP